MYSQPLFTIFGQSVYLYGIFIAVGILACMFVFYLYTKKKGMDSDVQDFVFLVAVFAIGLGFLFAKLFQAFYDFLETGVFDFYKSGITAMGGFIGGALVFLALYFGLGKFIFKRKKKNLHLKEFNKIFCVAPCCIVIAHAFGRLGCLMAGCCRGEYLGKNYVFGGVYMKPHGAVAGYYVPTQLYEALFLFVLFAVLSVMFFKKSNLIMHVYLIAYGVWRIFIEFFRRDERGAMVLGLAPSQWQSIVFIIIGIVLFVFYAVKKIPYRNDYETVKKKEESKDS